MKQLTKTLEDLIKFKTIFENKGEINKCLNYIEKKFKTDFYIKKFNFKERKGLILSNSKSKNLDLIFAGHVDVVPAPEKKFKPEIKKNKLIARGSYDMKGPLIAVIFAIRKYIRKNNKLKIAVFITSDEEIDGLSTKYIIEKQNYKAKFAIIPDGGTEKEIIVSQKGFWQFKLTIKGNSSHASEPWKGDNPINEAFKLINALNQEFPNPKNKNDWKTSVNVTKMMSGEAVNQIPSKTVLFFDARLILSSHKLTIKKIINKNLSNKYKLKELAFDRIMKVSKNNLYLKELVKAIEASNQEVSLSKSCSTSDAVFFNENKIPAVLFRPKGGGMHEDGEFVDVLGLELFCKLIYFYLESY